MEQSEAGIQDLGRNMRTNDFEPISPKPHTEILRQAGKIIEKRLGRPLTEEDLAYIDTYLASRRTPQGDNAFKAFMGRFRKE